MKKLTVLSVVLLVVILAVTTLGCAGTLSYAWLLDENGEKDVMLGGRLQPLGEYINLPPYGEFELADGNLRIIDTSEKVVIHGKSKLIGDDNDTAKFYIRSVPEEIHILSAIECIVNGQGGYNVVVVYNETSGTPSAEILVFDGIGGPQVYRWSGELSLGKFINH